MPSRLEIYNSDIDEAHATRQLPIAAFRHIHREDANYWRNGSVLLRPLSYYRTVESNELGIRDLDEGIVHSTINVDLLPNSDLIVRRRLARHNIIVAADTTRITMVESHLTQYMEDVYVLCMTRLPFSGIFKNRDYVIRVRSCAQIAQAIIEARSDVLSGAWAIGLVRYDKRVVDLGQEEPDFPSPFQKPPDFAYQQELRFCFWPRGKILDEVVATSEVIPPYSEGMEPLPHPKVQVLGANSVSV